MPNFDSTADSADQSNVVRFRHKDTPAKILRDTIGLLRRAEDPESVLRVLRAAAADLYDDTDAVGKLSEEAIAVRLTGEHALKPGTKEADGWADTVQWTIAAGANDGRDRQAEQQTHVGPQSEWIEPDLGVMRLNRRPAPTLPLSMLGERWATWAENSARAAAAPVDYVVAPLLAAASAVIGHARWAQAWEGWEEPPHLWCSVIGDSGDGKSPGASAVLRHIVPAIERRMAADFPDQMREAQGNIEAAKVRLEGWKEEVRIAIKEGHSLPAQPDPVPHEPIAPRLVLSDATIERVATLLATAAPKGVLMVRDELAGWLLGMNTYNDGARAFWLEAYGGGRFNVDRQKSPEPIIIPRFAVSWFGGIQPGRVAEIMQGADDGLLARFMWFWPDPVPFEKPKRAPGTDWAIEAFDRLRMLELASSDDGPRPLMVPLDNAAVDRMVAFGQAMQERKEATTGLMRSAFGKARGLALRLSLVLEYLHWCGEDGYAAPPGIIREDAFATAAAFVTDYVMPAAERTYGDAACSDADRNITTLARWIAKERPDAVHVRDMQRNVRLPGLTTADAIHAACKALIEAGWLGMPAGGGFRQKPKGEYPVSPRLSFDR